MPKRSERLTRILTVRVTPEEEARLRDAADDRDVSISSLARALLTSKPLPEPRPPATDMLTVSQLRSAGNLVNQALRVLHDWRLRHQPEEELAHRQLLLGLELLNQRIHDLARSLLP